MAFTPAGITDHYDMNTLSDYLLDAAWHPDGTMWAFINRGLGGAGAHYLSVYHPDTDTWDTRLLIQNCGGGDEPLAFSFSAARCAINKNGVCLFVFATGNAGSGKTFYRIIQPDLTIGAKTEFKDSGGGTVNGAYNGGTIGASIINDCTDFLLTYQDGVFSGLNWSAAEINSITAAVSNRRMVYDYTGSGDDTFIYHHSAEVSPVDGHLHMLLEYTDTSDALTQTRRLLHVEEGVGVGYYLPLQHLAHNAGPPARYYAIRPEMVVDNIVAGRVHVVYQVNTIGTAATGNSATYYIRSDSGTFSLDAGLFDTGTKGGTDCRSICIDGNGNVYVGFANNTWPSYSATATAGIGDGCGMECIQIAAETGVITDRLNLGYYPTSAQVECILPRMRPTTDTLMGLWRTGSGHKYNVDASMPGFITEAESQAGLGACEGMHASEPDLSHRVFVFDERVYRIDDEEPLA